MNTWISTEKKSKRETEEGGKGREEGKERKEGREKEGGEKGGKEGGNEWICRPVIKIEYRMLMLDYCGKQVISPWWTTVFSSAKYKIRLNLDDL